MKYFIYVPFEVLSDEELFIIQSKAIKLLDIKDENYFDIREHNYIKDIAIKFKDIPTNRKTMQCYILRTLIRKLAEADKIIFDTSYYRSVYGEILMYLCNMLDIPYQVGFEGENNGSN